MIPNQFWRATRWQEDGEVAQMQQHLGSEKQAFEQRWQAQGLEVSIFFLTFKFYHIWTFFNLGLHQKFPLMSRNALLSVNLLFQVKVSFDLFSNFNTVFLGHSSPDPLFVASPFFFIKPHQPNQVATGREHLAVAYCDDFAKNMICLWHAFWSDYFKFVRIVSD